MRENAISAAAGPDRSGARVASARAPPGRAGAEMFDDQRPNQPKGEIIMKHKLVIGIAVAAALVIVLPCFAQEADGAGRGACGIEGTWYGANTAGLNLIFRIEKNAGGGYSAVADGFSDPDLLVYCLDFTAWHGEVAKTGPNTYSFRQIELCDPNPDIFGPIPGLLLWATEGELTVVDCDRMEGDMPAVGAYFWGSGKVPFVDPFDIPFPDPVFGVFERMPGL